jgi:uncharacterized protein (DUF983 family)
MATPGSSPRAATKTSKRRDAGTFFFRSLISGFFKRCPVCHKGKMFSKYWTMRSHCPNCGVKFERESGEYIVAMYINILLTEVIFIGGYIITNYVFDLDMWTQIAIWAPFNLLFPILFYPHSKGLWAGVLNVMGGLYPD